MQPLDLFTYVYLAVLSALGVYGFHRMMLLVLYLRTKGKGQPRPPRAFDELPVVTVQLPMFNERYVARRLIDATAKIDYPKDRLEIQVLDDSTDDTRTIAAAAVEQKRAEGFDIHYIHRTDRTGYKAGALAAAMGKARGELIAIFDSDFIPNPGILRAAVDHFTDEKVALVQTRWEHINADRSVLTQVQALMLDGHFTIEHNARFRTGRYFNFNGTAGIWRKEAIEDGGGWQHDTITEDLDLSFRAQIRGWKFVYLPEVGSPAELPEDINGFKAQQYRWAKGSIQVARKLLWTVLSTPLPFKVRLEAFFHLTNNIAYLLMVPLALLILPTILFRDHHGLRDTLMIDMPLFLSTTLAIGLFYTITYREVHGTFKGSLWQLLLLMAVGIGISVNNARAVLGGLFSKDCEFVRTPKAGVAAYGGAPSRSPGASYRSKKSLTIFVELLLGFYFLATLVIAIAGGHYGSIPFLLLFVAGYLYVGFRSVLPALNLQRKLPAPRPQPQPALAASRSKL